MTLVFKYLGLCALLLSPTSKALDISDDQGQLIKITSPAQRVISYTLASDELLLALAKPEQIIALSPLASNKRYSFIAQAAKAYPQIHDVEQVISLKADLVLLASYNQAEIRHFLDKADIASFYFSQFNHIDNIKQHIQQLGQLLGRNSQAIKLQQSFTIALVKAKNSLKCQQIPAVLNYSEWGYVAGKDTIFQSLLDYLNIENLAVNVSGYQRLQLEWIYQQQPQIIIMPADPEHFNASRQLIKNHALLKHTPAVKNAHIFTIDQRYLNSISHHLSTGLQALVDKLNHYCKK